MGIEAERTSLHPPSPAAERMRLSRERRREGLRIIRIKLRVTEIDAFVRKGYLEHKDRDDPDAIQWATETFLSDALEGLV
jgi:hypothetical protein